MNAIPTLRKVWQFLIKNKLYLPYNSGISLKDTDPREMKAFTHKDTQEWSQLFYLQNWKLGIHQKNE